MTEPTKLPTMKWDEVKASAQRVLDLRGRPPYRANGSEAFTTFGEAYLPFESLSEDELRVLSEFVQFWLPFLVEKEKKS